MAERQRGRHNTDVQQRVAGVHPIGGFGVPKNMCSLGEQQEGSAGRPMRGLGDAGAALRRPERGGSGGGFRKGSAGGLEARFAGIFGGET